MKKRNRGGIGLEEGRRMDITALLNVRISDYDGKPIKNKLPEELKSRFLTEKQWLDEGMQLKEGARFVEMHPNAMNKKLCKYYMDEEVEPLSADREMCATCSLRYADEGRCPVMGSHVSASGHCSEWQ